jgi:hypothetical protein
MTPSLDSMRGSDGQPIHGVTCAALAEDQAALAIGTSLFLVQIAGHIASVVDELPLDEAPRAVALSPSRELVLAVDARRARVWNRNDAQPILELGVADNARMGALFGRSSGQDVLITVFPPSRLTLRRA